MSNVICPICKNTVPIYKQMIYQCTLNYDTHFYQFDSESKSEWIREFTIGFDILYQPKNKYFWVNIGSDPSFKIPAESVNIMDVYNKIVKMKAYL